MQENTRLSPAALKFGREIRTPVDLEFGPPPESGLTFKSGMDYFVDLQERMRHMRKLTRDSLGEAGLKQRQMYDVRTRGRDFAVGVFPSAENKRTVRAVTT